MSANARTDAEEPLPLVWITLGLILAGAGAWLAVNAVTLVTAGAVTPLAATASGVAELVRSGPLDRPAAAFAPEVARHMPDATGWWSIAASAIVAECAIAIGVWRRVDVARGRSILGRRAYDVRGSHPRSWARPRDLRDLVVRRPAAGRFTLGTLDRRLLASGSQVHMALIAPTRAGKTTRYVIPWLLEHDGPAVVTSTKRDVYDATHAKRARRGRVYLWDPFSDDSCGWDPLRHCSDWSHALRQARWLADATQEGDSEIASYWRGESARLLAPLLHAAALERMSLADVLAWLDTQDVNTPGRILRRHNAAAAVRQLAGIVALDPRNRGTTYMSAGSVLAAYRFPAIVRVCPSQFQPDDLLSDEPTTLYIVASDRDQRLLRPLVVALIATILEAAASHAREHGPLNPTLRVLLDEAANIAPLRDLPATLSQAAAHGIRIATVWQTHAQLRHRYGPAADGIVANSAAQLFLGPIGDPATIELLSTACERDQRSPERDVRQELRQLERGRALLVHAPHVPAVIRTPRVRANRPG